MIVARAIFFSALFLIVSSYSEAQYEVPEPNIEVFSPKGLRISIPDSRNVETVEFFIAIPRIRETLTHTANNPDGGYWMYWNPEIAVSLHEQIQYRLTVKHLDRYWRKEGVHLVENVRNVSGQPTNDPVDCEDIEGRKVIAGFGNPEEAARRHMEKISCSKQIPNFKSLFSTANGSDMKPITKSTTSISAGTFYLKPSGEIEATGYKSGSSFDSTKNVGEQWHHYRSDLTAEDIENMKKIYDSGFFGLREHGGRFFPEGSPGRGESSRRFHEARESHESSYVRTGNEPPNPSALHGGILRRREYVREEHTVPGGDDARGQGFSTSGFGPQEFRAGNAGSIETWSRSQGGIFASFKPDKPDDPRECVLVPGSDYYPAGNVGQVEKFARELSCLASVAEGSIKKEINSINMKNVELQSKVDWLEHEMKRLASSCGCY